MARASGSEKRRLEDAVLVRMEPAMAELARKAAAAREVSAAEWVRSLIGRAARLESRAPRRLRADPDTLRRLAEIATALGRQSGVLIQLAKAVRESGVSPDLHRNAEQALRHTRDAQAKLLAELERLAR